MPATLTLLELATCLAGAPFSFSHSRACSCFLMQEAAEGGGGGDDWDYSGSDDSSSEEEVIRKPKDATEGLIERVRPPATAAALHLARATAGGVQLLSAVRDCRRTQTISKSRRV